MLIFKQVTTFNPLLTIGKTVQKAKIFNIDYGNIVPKNLNCCSNLCAKFAK